MILMEAPLFMSDIVEVLDDGFVRLDYYSPKDPELQIVNSARISYNKRKKIMGEDDKGLIRYLMKNRHGTPFEMADFCFHLRLHIFVARELMRHRNSSFNEVSQRYTIIDTKFYVPKDEDVRKQVGKQGSYEYRAIQEQTQVFGIKSLIKEVYQKASENYELLLKLNVAKELARIVLPIGIYTELYYKTNARSLMNFLSLRNHTHAQFEIRQYAKVIEEKFFGKIMPITYAAFLESERKSP